MNIFRQIALGNTLTRMTNWWEAIEATRISMPIGAGGGIDSLPFDQRSKAQEELFRGELKLRGYPKHIVTEALIKNQEVAIQLGRGTRAEAQQKLFQHLVGRGLALSLEEFSSSYA